MGKTFRAWNLDQAWLLPPSVHDFVPPGHSAHLIRDLVRESLDLGAIFAAYPEERGQPPYHPDDDDGGVAVCLQPRHPCLAADRPGLRRAGRFHGRDRNAAAGLSHHQRLQEAPSAGAVGALFVQVLGFVPRGGAGEARPRGARWHPDQSQRLEAQSDELRPNGPGGGGAGRGGGGLARRRPRPRIRPTMPRAAWTGGASLSSGLRSRTRGRCPTGWPTRPGGWPGSVQPRRRWRPRRRPRARPARPPQWQRPPRPTTGATTRRWRVQHRRSHHRSPYHRPPYHRPPKHPTRRSRPSPARSPKPRRSATSPIPTAES